MHSTLYFIRANQTIHVFMFNQICTGLRWGNHKEVNHKEPLIQLIYLSGLFMAARTVQWSNLNPNCPLGNVHMLQFWPPPCHISLHIAWELLQTDQTQSKRAKSKHLESSAVSMDPTESKMAKRQGNIKLQGSNSKSALSLCVFPPPPFIRQRVRSEANIGLQGSKLPIWNLCIVSPWVSHVSNTCPMHYQHWTGSDRQ